MPALRFREVEQAVFATFLHSQPIGRDAKTRDLFTLLGHTQPDKIELEKALQRWTEVSWFLDESAMQNRDITLSGARQLPRSWRLGTRPNLRQMHHDASSRIAQEAVDEQLIREIQKSKSLTAGASAAGARVHTLPERPRDIEDDGDFHFAILGPRAASSPGKPSAEARRFLDEKTGPDSPRVYRNAVVLAVPSLDGLEAARNAIREALGWQEVEEQLKGQEVDINRRLMLDAARKEAATKVTELVRQAYCIVVTVSAKNEVVAFKVVVGAAPLFAAIKADPQSRIQETAVSAEALLPGGPYDLWRAGETSHRMKDLVEAFAQFSQLPKMLNRKAIQDTLLDGCRAGLFVYYLTRPDRTYRTFWREVPDEIALKDPALEVVLPEAAELVSLSPALLTPGTLPDLWQGDELTLCDLYAYFSGRVLSLQKDGYTEPLAIPCAARDVVDAAVLAAIKEKRLWLLAGPASFFAEDVPAGVLTDSATLQLPPQPIAPKDILSNALPEAWSGKTTSALDITNALSTKAGRALPWYIVREAIDAAIRSRWLTTTADSGPWPCDYTAARFARFSLPQEQPSRSTPAPSSVAPAVHEPAATFVPTLLVAEADLQNYELQDLAEQLGNLMKEMVGLNLRFHMRMELGPASRVPETTVGKVNDILAGVSERLRIEKE